MYHSKFASDMENMQTSLHNAGYQLAYLNYFLLDFDSFCRDMFPDARVLTLEIAEKWIRCTTSESKAHMSRRIRTMKHLGEYQRSLGKSAYIPNYAVNKERAEEPRLFSDEQLVEFFDKVDNEITPTTAFPHKDIIFPVMFRMIYCCGLRSSEACNLKVEDVDLIRGALTIYRSKGFKDRIIFMDDGLRDLCKRFHKFYSKALPHRVYFFQPSLSKDYFTSGGVGNVFTAVLKKTSFYGSPGKQFTPHGLRHLFAVQNIKKCVESGEDFANWILYLSKYMGHKHIRFTMYYLHITSQLFPVYSPKLRLLEEGIGVLYAEE